MPTNAVNVFRSLPVETDIERKDVIEFKSTSFLQNDSPLEFHIPASHQQYLDLQKSKLEVKVKLLRVDGSPITSDEFDNSKVVVCPTNLLLTSMFKQCEINLQQQYLVSSSINGNFPYKGYIDCVLDEADDGNRATYLPTQFYRKQYGFLDLKRDTLYFAAARFSDGNVVTLQGRIRSDITEIEKLLLNQVEVNIKLYQARDQFRIMTQDSDEQFKLVITDATFKASFATLSSKEMIHQNNMLTKLPAKYEFMRSDLKTFSLAAGSFNLQLENLYMGQIPSELILAFVKSEAYNGSFQTNPFFFHHYFISTLDVCVDGVSRPGPPLSMNFKQKDYTTAYLNLIKDTPSQKLGVAYEDFADGYSIFRFNLESEIDHKLVRGVQKKGNLRVTGTFAEALPCNVTVLAYARFPEVFYVDKERNVQGL